jgi:hypothetical protein
VSEPDDEHHWFYALGTGTDNRQKFYVRRDARSVELQGAEADRYKRQALHSRGSRRSNGERRR